MIFNVITPKRKSSLPAGYYRLDYIESTGTQWIDTERIIESDTERIVIDFEYTAAHDANSLFGSQGSNTGVAGNYTLIAYSTNPNFYAGGSRAMTPALTTALNTRYKLDVEASSNGTLTDTWNDTTTLSRSYTAGLDHTHKVYLFANNNDGNVDQICSMKLYGFELYDGGTLVRDMVPCFSAVDGEVGLYDKVNGVFYGNDGTGEFVGGNLIEEGSSTAIISVTAPTGSTVTATHSDGTVLTAEETNGHWTFKVTKFGSCTITGTSGTASVNQTVNVTDSKVYSVTLRYTITLTSTYSGSYDYASFRVDNGTYSSSVTLTIQAGAPVILTAYGSNSVSYKGTITVNGTVVAESSSGYVNYTIYPYSDVSIQLMSYYNKNHSNRRYGTVVATYATTAAQALALENDGMAAALSVMNIETGGQTTATTMDELQAENTTLKASLNELGVETEEQNAERHL